MSDISIFQTYDYFNTVGAKRNFTPEEQDLYDFCCENHEEICNYNENDIPKHIVEKVTELYELI